MVEQVGARWWKFDFHTHTPFSRDTQRSGWQVQPPSPTPEDWLLRYMAAGIDCVAITDHNGGGWIDLLKAAYARLAAVRPAGFREIYIFPGVELTVSGGVHLLVIFDLEQTTGGIDALLGKVGYNGTKGDSDDCTQKSLVETLKIVAESGGLCIPAHADSGKGILRTVPGDAGVGVRSALDPTTLKQALTSSQVIAMELVDAQAPLPSIYDECKVTWTRVLGSDCHGFNAGPQPGTRYTWVKMGKPSLSGLRLALLDGAPLSVSRSDAPGGEPNQRHGEMLIEAMEIDRAQFAGRGAVMRVPFSPWLTALVGGRGSGKSTLVQLLRWVFGAGTELPEAIRSDFEQFAKVHDPNTEIGALTPDATVAVVIRRAGTRLRVTRSVTAAEPTLEAWDDGSWKPAERGILHTLGVRVLAQREILELAASPERLTNLLDRAPEIAFAEWRAAWDAKKAAYLRVRGQLREIQVRLRDRDRIVGELHEVKRQLSVFEEGGSREILQTYQRVKRQRDAVSQEMRGLEAAVQDVVGVAGKLTGKLAPIGAFDQGVPAEAEALSVLEAGRRHLQELAAELVRRADAARDLRTVLLAQLASSEPGFPTKRGEGAVFCAFERSLGAVRALAAAGSGVEPGVEGGERLCGRSAARAVRNEGRRDACGGSGGSGP